ncbi:hypothetical protein MSLAZ_2185 [Methanosarcina lacustris Z-7289]|uniref:Mobile element protein n=1 Tax=Methanosarcina lacustris Z-7289 TaxID=1434111 RepID=A0A0E3S557_9EURY|nr:hypothetical protein [Methanosarcina lacustris]AKB75446.1 hypothetical protein MSLAZ_2185 [Methanosarcina lacustris Z-7289]
MEWTPTNYEKLFNAVEQKISFLSNDRIKSDIERHNLYGKEINDGGITQEDRKRIDKMCKYEDGIKDQIYHIEQLKGSVIEALDKLKGHIDTI